jgi:hypothetical protein
MHGKKVVGVVRVSSGWTEREHAAAPARARSLSVITSHILLLTLDVLLLGDDVEGGGGGLDDGDVDVLTRERGEG